MSLKILPIETKKDLVARRAVMKRKEIPDVLTFTTIVGGTGSGKSTLVLNLLKSKNFYGPKEKGGSNYFTEIHVFSPTVYSDPLWEELEDDIPDENKHADPNEEELQTIIDKAKEEVKNNGADKSNRILIVYDDIIACPKFVRSAAFRESIYANRHCNMTVFLLSQAYKQVPRPLRIQAHNLIYFGGNQSENIQISEEFASPGVSQKVLLSMIEHATADKHSFLFINKKADPEIRIRKNFDRILRPVN